ncbi:hypothetical protein BX666DRAFT_1967542 [Dichotomocladium elegans]|nr:hypothetical protein BX666DRAFT_1967542 [Dichotomocladium elegans]
MIQYKDQKVPESRFGIIRWFGFDQFVPELAVTSFWVSPKTLLFLRFFVTLYSAVVIWADIGRTAQYHGFNTFFGYFTNLTFIGLHAYLVTAFYHNVRYVMVKPQHNPSSFFDQPSFLNYAYVYLYHTIVVFNIVTPVVYWALLNSGGPSSPFSTWINVSVHGVSFFLMMFEVIFSRMQMMTRMVLLVFIQVVVYMFLSFVVYAATGIWVYSFLDWSKGPIDAAYYIGVGAAFVVVFFLQMGFHWIRDAVARLSGRAPPHAPKKIPAVMDSAMPEKEEV